MLALDIERFAIELQDGRIEHVGASEKAASAKLFDVDRIELREFGDSQLKLVAGDDAGNELQIALFPEQANAIADGIESMAEDSPVFE